MNKLSKKVIAIFTVIVFAGIIIIPQLMVGSERNAVNRFALVNGVPVRIEEGAVYQYEADGTWNRMELEGAAVQVFSGENLCVRMEDGKLFFDGVTTLPEEEEYPLTSAYGVEMIGKAVEVNETEDFFGINGNVEYPGFRALLEDGRILYQGLENYEYYQMQDEQPVQLSGQFVLTETGNVYYLQIDTTNGKETITLEKVYDGGDMAVISASETAPRCIGIKENGKVESLWVNQMPLAVSDWKNMIAVCQGFYNAVGLDSHGQVYYVEQNVEMTATISAELNKWSDIVQIALLGETIVGMKEDSSCLFLNIADYK